MALVHKNITKNDSRLLLVDFDAKYNVFVNFDAAEEVRNQLIALTTVILRQTPNGEAENDRFLNSVGAVKQAYPPARYPIRGISLDHLPVFLDRLMVRFFTQFIYVRPDADMNREIVDLLRFLMSTVSGICGVAEDDCSTETVDDRIRSEPSFWWRLSWSIRSMLHFFTSYQAQDIQLDIEQRHHEDLATARVDVKSFGELIRLPIMQTVMSNLGSLVPNYIGAHTRAMHAIMRRSVGTSENQLQGIRQVPIRSRPAGAATQTRKNLDLNARYLQIQTRNRKDSPGYGGFSGSEESPVIQIMSEEGFELPSESKRDPTRRSAGYGREVSPMSKRPGNLQQQISEERENMNPNIFSAGDGGGGGLYSESERAPPRRPADYSGRQVSFEPETSPVIQIMSEDGFELPSEPKRSPPRRPADYSKRQVSFEPETSPLVQIMSEDGFELPSQSEKVPPRRSAGYGREVSPMSARPGDPRQQMSETREKMNHNISSAGGGVNTVFGGLPPSFEAFMKPQIGGVDV